MSEDEIDYSDSPELNDSFWTHAQQMDPKNQVRITMELDPDIVIFFRKQGRGFPAQINAVLRSYMEAH